MIYGHRLLARCFPGRPISPILGRYVLMAVAFSDHPTAYLRVVLGVGTSHEKIGLARVSSILPSHRTKGARTAHLAAPLLPV